MEEWKPACPESLEVEALFKHLTDDQRKRALNMVEIMYPEVREIVGLRALVRKLVSS